MATLKITIKYPIIGYTQTVSGGVVTGTTRVVFDPNKIIDDIWPKVTVEDEFSGFTFEDDGEYIKLDEVFWENFEGIIQQQPADDDLVVLSPAWACKWQKSTVQFFVGGSSEPAERLPTDGDTVITAVVTEFAKEIPVNLSYKEAISEKQIGDQVKTELDFNLTTLNEWDMKDVPDGWYAASAQLGWGPSGGYVPPDMISIPSFFNYLDTEFKTNDHVPRCIVNIDNENPLTVEGTTISYFCRDAAILQVVAALNFLYKECDSIPTITVACHKDYTAPAICSAKYFHYLGEEEELLFDSSSGEPLYLYLSKDHKVDNITDLCYLDEWRNACLDALIKKGYPVDESSSIVEIEDKTDFDDSYGEDWTCHVHYEVRATHLKVYLDAATKVGSDMIVIYDKKLAVVEVGTTKYIDLFERSKTTTIDGKSTRVFLEKIAYKTLNVIANQVILYDTICSDNIIKASYSANYNIALNFYSNLGYSDNNLYFYPERREDKIKKHCCYTTQQKIITEEDKLNQSIYDLLSFGTKYQTIEGDVFVYYINRDATLNGNRVVPDSGLESCMKPQFSSFHEATEQNESILNQSLEYCIEHEVTEINFEVKPQPPKEFDVKTHWKLLSRTGDELGIVRGKSLKWYTYANYNQTFEALCTFYKANNSIRFLVEEKYIPNDQWSINYVANSDYGSGSNKFKEVIPYNADKLSDLYVSCIKSLEFLTYNINRRNDDILTISKKNSNVYQQASLKIPDDIETIRIAKELADQSLLPILSGGAVIFLSNGEHSAQTTFEDWPGFIDAPEADQISYEGKKCDKLFNVNRGVGMNCQYLKILDGSSDSLALTSYLTSNEYMYQSTAKRRFFIGLVGAGGGGGGGDLQWFDSNGGSGGGGGGYTLFACNLDKNITDKDMDTLTISWSGGLGGDNGGRNSSGGSGSTATLTLSITRNGSTIKLAEFTAYGGKGGGAYNGNGGGGADAPTHVIFDDSLIEVDVVIQKDGLSGQRPEYDTATFDTTSTDHRDYFEVEHSWIGYEIARALSLANISNEGGVQTYAGEADESNCDEKTSNIFAVLNDANKYNVYQLFPGGFTCKGGYDDNENGGPGAPSVVGPGSIFNRDGSYGYERPCPGCGGCGSGHWLRGDWWSDKDDEVCGRPGGNAMFAILC